MKCPRDGAELKAEIYQANIEIDRCPGCTGVWLDKGELERIQQSAQRDYTKELGTPEDAVAEMLKRRDQPVGAIACPKCGGETETREYAWSSQVLVDTCVDGCGMWLDAGELEQLEVFFERQREKARNDPADTRLYLWASLLSIFHRPKKKKK
jgi:uncharacterized protein